MQPLKGLLACSKPKVIPNYSYDLGKIGNISYTMETLKFVMCGIEGLINYLGMNNPNKLKELSQCNLLSQQYLQEITPLECLLIVPNYPSWLTFFHVVLG